MPRHALRPEWKHKVEGGTEGCPHCGLAVGAHNDRTGIQQIRKLNMKKLMTIVAAGLFMACLPSGAQKFSVSTDLLGYAFFGTMNADVSLAVSRKWRLTAGVRCNPFTFRKGEERQFQVRQQSYALGARLWPWHTGSGWWLAGKLRYQEYNQGGLFSMETSEGDRFGAGMYAGYTHMLGAHLNIEFGAGLWWIHTGDIHVRNVE